MPNYIYENIDELTISEELSKIFNNRSSFGKKFPYSNGQVLPYKDNPYIFFFNVKKDNDLVGYIWLEFLDYTEEDSNLKQYGIELSIAKSLSTTEKGFTKKVIEDLDHIRTLLPKEWLKNNPLYWLSLVYASNQMFDYLLEILKENGFKSGTQDYWERLIKI